MKTFGKILIAAAAATAAVVVAKKVMDELAKNDENSKLVKSYKDAVKSVKNIINGAQEGKPKRFDTDGYDIDFYEEDDEYCRCMCDECLFEDGCDDDGEYFDIEDDDASVLYDDSIDYIQTENAEPTDEEIQEIINEEMAQEQIDKILSEMDIEESAEDNGEAE